MTLRDRDYSEAQNTQDDRLWTITYGSASLTFNATHHVIGYSAEDAVLVLIRWLSNQPQPEGFSIKELIFTASDSHVSV